MDLNNIFNAQSLAIIGASKDERKRGYQAIKTLQDEKFEGEIYAVNPRGESILGIKCHKNINDIKADVDIALITTPAATIPAILEDCGKKGVKGVVIIAGGFRELGKKGGKLSNKMMSTAKKYNIRIVGPNTSGIINVNNSLNLVGTKKVPKGDIALLTQSGNIALHIITEAKLKSRQGFSYYVGVGNEADIKFHEYLEFFSDDPTTKAILIYVEGMSQGRKFLQQAYKTTLKKPIILLKSGRSSTGHRSASSHTGALAGMSEVARSSFVRAGIIYIENEDELFPAAESLSILPPIRNNKIAILADGGGHATIAADLLSDFGVEIPKLSKKTRDRLMEVLPPNASVRNPIDVAGGTDSNPAVFADCVKIILEDKHIGGLLMVGLFGGYGIRFAETLKFIEEDAAHRMGKILKKSGKPIIVQSLYNFARPHSLELLRYYDIPVYDSLDIACKCISVLSDYGRYLDSYHKKVNFVFNRGARSKEDCKNIIGNAYKEGRSVLLEHECKEILRMHGAPVSLDQLAESADDAVEIARGMYGKKVLKIVSPDILHKSDAGGVKLNLETENDIRNAFNEIMDNAKKYKKDADIRGCLVSRMISVGTEVIIGTKIDEQFGPVIMFGMGGIFVEILKDVSFRVLPIDKMSARTMISEIKSAPILSGVRGQAPLDKRAIADLLVTVSEIIEAYPRIREMDLNPVIVHEKGITIVDARIILNENRNS